MKHLLFFCIAAAALLVSCDKNTLTIPADPAPAGARLKLVNAAPDLAGGVELAVNGTKFSAYTPSGATTTSSGIPIGLPYINTFPNTTSNYGIVTPGSVSLSLTSPATSTVTSATALGQQTATLDDNVYYSLFISGTGVQPTTTLVKDDFAQLTAQANFYVRFVNLIPNAATGYDLLLSDGKTVVAQNVGYKAVSPYVPFDANLLASFILRPTGSTTSTGTYTLSGLANGRVLTVFARGVVGRTGTAAPGLTGYINR